MLIQYQSKINYYTALVFSSSHRVEGRCNHTGANHLPYGFSQCRPFIGFKPDANTRERSQLPHGFCLCPIFHRVEASSHSLQSKIDLYTALACGGLALIYWNAKYKKAPDQIRSLSLYDYCRSNILFFSSQLWVWRR